MDGSINKDRVLIVIEDSDDDYEYIEQLLEEKKFLNPVHRCEDGEEAIAYLESKKDCEASIMNLGLITLDLNLPGIDGKKVLEYIKNDDVLKLTPVIVISSSSNKADIHDCYELGVNSYIQKPSDLQEFNKVFEIFAKYWFETAKLPNREVRS